MSSSDEDARGDGEEEHDYDGGEWIDGEFYAATKRQRRHQSKEEQLYGVFAEGESDSEERQARRRGAGGAAQQGAAFAKKPVAFVSSGVVGGDPQPPPPPPRQQAPARDDMDTDDAPRGGLGLGASAGGSNARPGLGASSGLGFVSGSAQEEEDDALPSAFGQRLKEAADARRREADAKARRDAQGGAGIGAPRARGGASARQPAAPAPGATFEAHTRGIGSKLLEKMGYKAGQGLGREGTGIAEAIQTKLRPKNMGMGYNEYQEQTRLPADAEVAEPEAPGRAAPGAAAPAPAKGGWKRRAKEARQKRVYKTAEELLRESEADGPRMTVVDMRGTHARVVTNLERLSEAPTMADAAVAENLIDATPMPELQHNLRLIVDLAEAEIQALDRKLRNEKDTHTILVRETARLRTEVESHSKRVAKAQEILDAVTAAISSASSQPPSADELGALADSLRALRMQHPEDWAIYGLANVALAQALPALVELFAGWSPLEAPTHGVKELSTWRPLLESPAVHEAIFGDVATAEDPYARLFAETALPPLRSAVVNHWNPRDPEPLLRCLEAYNHVLPPAARVALLDSSVLPKLMAAVDTWDPRTEPVPIHTWIHPWLPLLRDRLLPLYAPIRHKLSSALGAWHPGDGSALALLSPWRQVFTEADWEAMLSRCILPKLGWGLSQLVINPADQKLEPVQWTLAWAAAVPARHMATLLEQNFFPKWHAVLHAWLSAAPNFDEVTRWYLGWKSLFPEEMMSHERVRRGFNAALDMMNQAVAGQLGPPPSAPVASAGAAMPPQPTGAAPMQFEEERGYGGGLSLRELVESFAEQNDVPFMPKPGRTHAGMQVYSFGGVSVVIDAAREEMLAQRLDGDRGWVPASIEQLLEMHAARKGLRAGK